jgi:hypothetical protein
MRSAAAIGELASERRPGKKNRKTVLAVTSCSGPTQYKELVRDWRVP